MRGVILAVMVLLCIGTVVTLCHRRGDFITNTSPFLSEYVPTPSDGHRAIARRAAGFAKRHRMKLHYLPGHFQSTEFTIAVTRDDLNIAVGNVLLGKRTLVTAVVRATPTPQQRAEVGEFMCSVMFYRCER